VDNIVPFKKPRPSEKHRNKTLCRSGFHKWQVVQDQPFDVKRGKLVTVYRCERCGATKSVLR